MNQHVSPHRITRKLQRSKAGFDPEFIRPMLRLIAARMNMHNCALHWLGSGDTSLDQALIVSTWRVTIAAGSTLQDLCPADSLIALAQGGEPIKWHRSTSDISTSVHYAGGFGLSIAFHDAYGTHLAITCSNAEDQATLDCDLFKAMTQPFLASLASSYRLQNALTSTVSARELSCLQWAAAGKTSYETSIILELSENTVNQHIASAASKLGAMNRTHAVAKAAKLGLINFASL
jgi:DNA-binding CsgD family transcriptional regulator